MKARELLDNLVNRGAYVGCAKEAHDAWRSTKESQGWVYGVERDAAKKTNPLMVDYEVLPAESRGQSCLTPYAVVNYFRVEHGENTLTELDTLLQQTIVGSQPQLLEQVGEYVHSHFIAAQMVKGATVQTRDDMCTYEALTSDQRSWDVEMAKSVMQYLRREVAKKTE